VDIIEIYLQKKAFFIGTVEILGIGGWKNGRLESYSR
jgi:hypothetical protein